MSKQLAGSDPEELLNRYLKGDYLACGQLLLNPDHRQRVERIARKQTRGTSVSWEDASQNAHIKLLQVVKAGKFRQGRVDEFYRWAATVARFEIIDLVRREQQWNCKSLDQTIPGTDLPLLETIPDDFSALDAVERTDLVLMAIDAIATIDRLYPDRGYLKLWQGRVQGKNQSQLAAELCITQGAISKRWQELSKRIAEALGLLPVENVKQELLATRKQKTGRRRSDTHW